MAEEVSLVFKMANDVTGEMRSIAGQSRQCSKEFEVLQKQSRQLGDRYTQLNKDAAKTAAQATAVKKEMNEAAKAFRKTGDAADQVRLEALTAQYNELTDAAKGYRKAAQETVREMTRTADTARRLTNSSGGSGGKLGSRVGAVGQNLVAALGAAGTGAMAASLLQEGGTTLAGSLLGSTGGNVVGSALSSAMAGAAAGSMLGPHGALVGGLLGAAGGALSGGIQAAGERDQAFKSYVQDSVQGQLQQQDQDLTSGSAIAAGREMDLIAFSTMLKDQGAAQGLMEDLVDMANDTPFLFEDLKVMSKVLTTYRYGLHEMIPTLTDIGDAGAALGMMTHDMEAVATALGRMRSSGKTTLEYINPLQERGVDAVGYLAEALGTTNADVYDRISRGKIDGGEASRIIQEGMHRDYGGAMAVQAGTFGGLSSTLEGLNQEQQNAMGAGYNAVRKEGMKDQIDWMTGETGAAIEEANRAIGAWKAELENTKEQYLREAVEAAMGSDQYQQAQAADDAAEMGRILMEAQIKGMGEYNDSEGAQLKLQSERQLIENVRDDAGLHSSYWDAGYTLGKEFEKGLAAARAKDPSVFAPSVGADMNGKLYNPTTDTWEQYAYGLERVPYDGYPAVLHQGERVLTAQQARAQDRSGGNTPITITGNTFHVRQESDIEAVAAALAVKLREANDCYGG